MGTALPFYFAWVDEIENFGVQHCRSDESIFNATFSHEEGDFATLTLEIANPRVGFLAEGRKRWCYFSWTPNWNADDDVDFDNVQLIFKGRIVGIPEDLENNVIKVQFIARPSNFDAQKEALAASLRVLPYWDPIWFNPDTVDDPDNVIESRNVLWHIDAVTHVVSVSSITVGEDGTCEFGTDDVFDGSMSLTYGAAPTRQINVTATVSWDQIASGPVTVIENLPFDSYTGQGVVDNWPKAGDNIGGGWSVAPGSEVHRLDGWGTDTWTYDDKQILTFNFASHGKSVLCPTWAFRQTVLFTTFPAHLLVLKRWKMMGSLAVQYDVSRGKSETVQFAVTSDTQELLTDENDTAPVELSFSSSEVSQPIDIVANKLVTPLGKPWARSYLSTDRGDQSIEYLLMVARAKLLSSARCVDLKFEVPFEVGMLAGVSLRKSCVVTDDELPGGYAGGKIKAFEYTTDGDTGALNCSITVGATIGRGGVIEAVPGDPDYCDENYVGGDYQRFVNEFVMPVAGEIAYSPLNGAPPSDDGIDFDKMYGSSIYASPFMMINGADTQEHHIISADQPADIYKGLNEFPTTFSLQMKPLNNGPFVTNYSLLTSSLKIPKTINLESGGIARISAHMNMGAAINVGIQKTIMLAVAFQMGVAEAATIQFTRDLEANPSLGLSMTADVYSAIMRYVEAGVDEGLIMDALVKSGNPPGLRATGMPFGLAMSAALQVYKAVSASPQMGIQMAAALQRSRELTAVMSIGMSETAVVIKEAELTAPVNTLGINMTAALTRMADIHATMALGATENAAVTPYRSVGAVMAVGASETSAVTKSRFLTATMAFGSTEGVSALSHSVPVAAVQLAMTGTPSFTANNNAGGTSLGVAYNSGAGANTIIVATFQTAHNSGNVTVSSVTDNHGLTWHRRNQFLDGRAGQSLTTEIWWAFSPTAISGTITATLSGNPAFGASAQSFCVVGVLDTANPFDANVSLPKQAGGGNGSALTAVTSGTVTTSGTRTIAFAVMQDEQGNGGPPTPGSGWTALSQSGNGTHIDGIVMYRVLTAPGSFTATTTPNEYAWSMLVDALVGNA